MDRRNFFTILSTVSAGLATNACGNKTNQLIPLLVPDHEIVPGQEQWHPSVCGECSAGCGTTVRVMEGERIIERNGEKFRERIAAIKKIEGNPLDPVSGGRLCALGHAALQSLYNPDRLRGPMKRIGERGQASFQRVSWEEAIDAVVEKLKTAKTVDPHAIACLTGPDFTSRTATLQAFLQALGAPHPLRLSLDSFAIEMTAAESVFGWKGLPVYDLARAHHALGVGADFLGGWASPVYYGRQFGQFRQGRLDIRGNLVQAESRMSLTAANADEWLPIHPGSEPQFIAALARVLLDEKLAHEQLPAHVTESIAAVDLPALISHCGIEEHQLRTVARILAHSEAPLVIAGASLVHTNSLDAIIASHYLNLMLGNVGKLGGLLPPSADRPIPFGPTNLSDNLKDARVLLLDGANPVYTLPAASQIPKALAAMDLIVSFSSFIDDSSAFADMILPDHHILESDIAVIPLVAPRPSATVAVSFVRPLYDTKPLDQTLSEIARKMNLQFSPVTAKAFSEKLLPAQAPSEHFWADAVSAGGVWNDTEPGPVSIKLTGKSLQLRSAEFAGPSERFPFFFQPYLSLQFHDGRGANLPWMQELPDPASSAMWELPVELDTHTAAHLNVSSGDRVRIESPHGSLEAWAYVHPGALPGVLSMGIGQGHTHYGRYASGRGANPLAILAPVWESATGALASGGTRVRVSRIVPPPGGLIQFSPVDREQGPSRRV